MVEFVYETASDAGYDPCLVFNNLDRDTQIRLDSPLEYLRFDPEDAIETKTVQGMQGKAIRLVFPEVEFTQYVLNGAAWRRATADGDVFFAVGGTNHCCTPFVRSSVEFGSWTATPLWSDRVDRLQSAPLVERVRDYLSRPLLERLEKRAYREADPALVLSDYTERRLRAKYGFDSETFEVVPFPVDTDRFTPTNRDTDPSPEGPVVLFVGRLTDPRKNVELLIEAFATVRQSVDDARLWLVGDEPDRRLRDAAERSGSEEAIEFLGPIPNAELPAYYRAADLFAIPSNQEGLGIVGLEALACGTPVVSTRCGGPEQYVEDGRTGYLVDREDASALAERVTALLREDTERERMSAEATAVIEAAYSESVIADRFVDALDRLSGRDRA